IDLSGFDGFLSLLEHARQVIRVNGLDESPFLQLLLCSAEIFQRLAVQKLHLSHRAGRSHEPRNAIADLTPREFARTQRFLSTLAILNVYTGSVPFEDVARFIPERIGANQEPSIGTIETANSRFRVDPGARGQTRLPLLDKFLTVVRMNRF